MKLFWEQELKASVSTTVVQGEESFKRIIVRKDFALKRMSIHCFVAGFRHNDGKAVIDMLEAGERLFCVHEKMNAFDKNAVAIYTEDYIQLGYIPRMLAPVVAKSLDETGDVKCRIKKVNNEAYHSSHEKIEIVLSIPM